MSLAALLCLSEAGAQQRHRLNDDWKFLQEDLGGVWEAVRPIAKVDDPEASPIWQPVQLPHCVNATDAVDPDVNYYQGPAWYKTQLDINNPYSNGRTLLHFEGAGQKTEVYIYTTKVGTHVGGYDEWSVDITDAVEAFKKTETYTKQFKGKIPLSIRTDNSRDLEMIPSDLSDFNLYGGIYRYLNLMYQPAVSIDKIFATPTVDKNGTQGSLTLKARFYDPLAVNKGQLSVQLISPAGKEVYKAHQSLSSLKDDIVLTPVSLKKPALWSPDLPQLYTLNVTVTQGGQSYLHTEKIGFRHTEFVQKGPFLLNGKRFLLRGTQRHEDHAGAGAAMTEELMRQEMVMIKKMGANFIRLGHYQQSKLILQLCDSLGILVWEEIPWCRGGLGGVVYQDMAKRMLTNMIEQHYNHTSVIIWGIGNENDWPGDFSTFDTSKIRSFMKELNELSHKLDTERKTAIRRCDFCKDIVDVYSPSIWAGWYRGIYTEYKEISKAEADKVDHFLHAEWGGDSHAGRHSETPDKVLQSIKRSGAADERAGDASLYGGAARASKDGDWSESYIVNLFDWHLKEQETMPWLTGSAQWVFKDFSTAIRPDNPVPYMNQKGVVERDLTPKESYYVFQSYWTKTPMVHIYGHSWPVRWGNEGEFKMLKVYSNCTEAELWLNGKSLGKRKRNSQDFPAAGLRWETPLNTGINKVFVKAWKGKEAVTDSIEFIYQTRKWEQPAQLVLKKIKQEKNIVTVEATLLDAKGVLCLDAKNFVRFGITGDGKLLDNLGTANGARRVQLSNGRAIIKIDTNNGKNAVSVSSDGLPTAIINL